MTKTPPKMAKVLRITLGLAAWTVAIWANRIWNIINSSNQESLFWPILFISGALVLLLALYIWSENMITSQVFAVLVSTFGFLSIGRWAWSLTTTWIETNSLGFRLIHTVLALVTAVLSFRAAQLIWKISLGERKLEQLSEG